MVPLYAARVSDLKPGDFVVVECGACGHDGLIHPTALPSLGLGPDERVVDLAPRLRCRECDAKGKVVVSVRWNVEQRLLAMTPDERAADAIALVERARARLAVLRTIEHEPEE